MGSLLGEVPPSRAVEKEIAKRGGKPLCDVVLSTDDEAGALMAAQAVMSGCYVGEAPELPDWDCADPCRPTRATSEPSRSVLAPVMPPLRPLSHGRKSRGRRRGSGAASRSV